jgi:hypothetical protein
MKFRILSIIFLSCLIINFCADVNAQQKLSKSERKALKKEIKTYKKAPESYADMKDKNAKTIQSQEREIDSLKSALGLAAEKIDALNILLSDAKSELEALQAEALNCGKVPSKGTVYSVQVGNYKKLDLRESFSSNKGLRTENFTGGNAYMVGNFTTVEEALEFTKNIKKLGITDAFVTQYIDGERIIDFDVQKGR